MAGEEQERQLFSSAFLETLKSSHLLAGGGHCVPDLSVLLSHFQASQDASWNTGRTTGLGVKEPEGESQAHHLKNPSLSFPICKMGAIPALQGCCEDHPRSVWHIRAARLESALCWMLSEGTVGTRRFLPEHTGLEHSLLFLGGFLQRDGPATNNRSSLSLPQACCKPQRNFSARQKGHRPRKRWQTQEQSSSPVGRLGCFSAGTWQPLAFAGRGGATGRAQTLPPPMLTGSPGHIASVGISLESSMGTVPA